MQIDSFMEEVSTWSRDCSPEGRNGHRISCTDSFLYSVGGYNPAQGPLKEAWRLNVSTGEWEELSDSADVPPTCISHCMTSVGKDLLTFGGTGYPFGDEMTCEVHACDKNTGQWRVIESEGNIPPELYGQACRRMGDQIYVVGGTSGYHFSLEAYAFHLPTSTWTCLATTDLFKGNESSGRYKCEIGVLPGRIVVVGGSAADTVFPLDEVPVLDIDSQRWALKATKPDKRFHAFPSPRKCHASVQRGTDLYIIGGANGDEVFDDIWRLNLKTLVWTRLNLVLPVPLYFHAAAVSPNGSLYVYGGTSSVGSSEKSTAVYRALLQAPPLLEAAWSAFTTNCPSITTSMLENPNDNYGAPTPMDFLEAGVPRRLIHRLKKLPNGQKYQ